ncbi:MAG TPA: hypothetical protein VN703_02830 [Candidatus Sulfopaludibacter sp.]|nr:hypothetical protein [Candidatus Sulfopaludibacter sp.]
MKTELNTYEITVSKPHRDFTKAETKTFFRNAKSLSELKSKSWLFNSSGIFHGAKAIKIDFDKDIKGIDHSDF